jgi:FkbM family methyltransferase
MPFPGITKSERIRWALRRRIDARTIDFMGRPVHFMDAVSANYLIDEIMIGGEYDVALQSSTPRIIDCGSNIGFASLYFKLRYPAASITCIEAVPAVFNVLKKNVNLWGYRDITCVNCAVGASDGSCAMYMQPGNEAADLRASRLSERGGESAVLVEKRRLSAFCNDSVDLLKLDVEGVELEVLSEMRDSGALSRVRQLVVECHHNVTGLHDVVPGVLRLLSAAGFKWHLKARWGSDARRSQDVVVWAVQ